jgi:hypothetical protein
MVNGVKTALPAELEPLPEPIETTIGRATAVCASLLAAEIEEWRDGGVKPATMHAGADALAQLYALRTAVIRTGELDASFEVVARAEGFRALREHCDNSDGLIVDLIDGTLEILANVVRAQADTRNSF